MLEVARENIIATTRAELDKFALFTVASLVRGGGGAASTSSFTASPSPSLSTSPSPSPSPSPSSRPSTATLRLHIEGWRGLPHSFAVVAADLLHELAAHRPGVNLSFSDAPLPPHWDALRAGQLSQLTQQSTQQQQQQQQTHPPEEGEHAVRIAGLPLGVRLLPLGASLERDAVVLRIAYPFDGRPDPRARRTVVQERSV